MKPVIYKYKLDSLNDQEVEMPRGAKPLSVETQLSDNPTAAVMAAEDLVVWAMVDLEETRIEPKRFWVMPTGQPFNFPWANTKFLGTVKMRNGALIWHVFHEA